jgi:hypothetical protein
MLSYCVQLSSLLLLSDQSKLWVMCMQVHSGLRELELGAPPGVFDPDALADLNTAAVAAPRMIRAHVLLGLHHRVGAASSLRQLPVEVLRQVLNEALPLRGCKLLLTTPKQLEQELPGL